MPYEQVQGYANLYGEQALLIEQMRHVQFHEAEIMAPMAIVKNNQSMPEHEFDAMLTDATRTQMDLSILGQSLKGLDQLCLTELRKL